MRLDDLVTLTRQRLGGRPRRVVPPGPLVRAAVLVPLVDRGEACLVFGKRTDYVGSHAGQFAFPGGRVEPTDASALQAALREAEEEIGLPAAAVEALGVLDDEETVATQFVITPYVARVRGPVAWRPDGKEIERVIEVPLTVLLAPGACRVEMWERAGVRRPVYFYEYGGDVIWGATARILKGYLELVAPAAA